MNCIPKKLSFIRQDLTSSSRIFFEGNYWIPKKQDKSGFEVRSEADPDLYDFIGHEELYDALKSGDASVDLDYHSASQTRLRSFVGDKRLSEFKPEGVALALNKEKVIHFVEAKIKAASKKLTYEELKNALIAITSEINRKAMEAATTSSYSNTPIKVTLFKVPTVKTFIKYWEEYNFCDRDVRSLIPRHHGPGKRKLAKVDSESLAIWVRFAHEFASSRKPTKAKLLEDCVAHIDTLNKDRHPDQQLTAPKRKRFENIINAMDKFETMAAREGIAKARAHYRVQLTGFDIVRPGERIEFDTQLFEVQTWLRAEEIWQFLSLEARKALLRKRIYLLMARDAATGYVAAVNGVVQENSEAVIDTLDMALSDKSHIARAVGAETDWHGGVVFQDAYTDNGKPYISEATHKAFRAAGVNLTHPPAGQPWHRGFIETIFAKISGHLMQYMDGRTFSDVGAKGDYDSVGNATLTAEEALALLIRAILDIYHHQINVRTGETPHNAWVAYLEDTGVRYDVDPHKRRHTFGISLKRKVHAEGMWVWGIRFQSDALQAQRQRKGSDHQFEVRFHKADLRWISVLTDDGWITVPNRVKLTEQIGVYEWLAAAQMAKEDAENAQQPFVERMQRAINNLRSSGDAAALRAGISPHTPSNFDLLKRQAALFDGRDRLKYDTPEDAIELQPLQLGDDPLREGGIAPIKLIAKEEPNTDPVDEEQPLFEEPDNTEDDDDDDQFA